MEEVAGIGIRQFIYDSEIPEFVIGIDKKSEGRGQKKKKEKDDDITPMEVRKEMSVNMVIIKCEEISHMAAVKILDGDESQCAFKIPFI